MLLSEISRLRSMKSWEVVDLSISDKLIQIRRIQQAIRAAIIGKGISIDGDFSTYPDAIELLKNPKGSMSITENGSYDVTEKVTAVVNVPASGITPSGSISIVANGTYDVTEKASATVNVPVGVFPSGTLSISENGIYDVSDKASVNVSIPVGASLVFGQVSGSGAKTLSISAAVGKDNIAVFLISTTSSNLSVATIMGAGYINGSMYMTYKSSSNIMRLSTTASWNKSTGVIAYTGSSSYNFTNNTNLKYMYVAW